MADRDQERLLALGRISESEQQMRAIESRVTNAVTVIRNMLALYQTAADLDIAGIDAAVEDLRALVHEYRILRAEVIALRARWGIRA